MANKAIKFEIVTPERVVLSRDIIQVTVPTTSGEITVLADHIPLVSILKPGVIEILLATSEREIISVSGGFIEVMHEKIVILADTAERAAELDEQKIEEAKTRAEARKKEAVDIDDVQFANISAQLEKEMARSKALSRWRRLKNIDSR